MGILNLIGDIFAPAAKLIDDVHTSSEEKLVLKNEMAKIQQSVSEKVIELESKILDSKTSIIVAEANGSSWLQRLWRPLLMCVFAALLVFTWLGGAAPGVPTDRLFDLLELGIGGYIGGRTAEKIATTVFK